MINASCNGNIVGLFESGVASAKCIQVTQTWGSFLGACHICTQQYSHSTIWPFMINPHQGSSDAQQKTNV